MEAERVGKFQKGRIGDAVSYMNLSEWQIEKQKIWLYIMAVTADGELCRTKEMYDNYAQ